MFNLLLNKVQKKRNKYFNNSNITKSAYINYLRYTNFDAVSLTFVVIFSKEILEFYFELRKIHPLIIFFEVSSRRKLKRWDAV